MALSDDSEPVGDGPGTGNRLRLEHLRVGLPGVSPVSDGALSRHLTETLAPFVAWLATQQLDEDTRRRYRHATERFLRWSHADDGPVEDRRRRYERHLRRHDPEHVDEVIAALKWWTDHRRLVARTLPVDG